MVRDKRYKRISLFISRWSDKIRDDGGDGDGDGDGDGGETRGGDGGDGGGEASGGSGDERRAAATRATRRRR
jgi:hypothetical protein